MNEQKQYARITRMAMPEDAHLIGRIGIVSEDTVTAGNTQSIIVLIDGNPQFVCGGDYELLTMDTLYKAFDDMHTRCLTEEFCSNVNAERGNYWQAEHDALETEVEHLRYWAMLGASAVEDARDALHMWDLNAPGSDEHGMLLLSYRFSESYGWSEVAQLYAEVEQLRWPDEAETIESAAS